MGIVGSYVGWIRERSRPCSHLTALRNNDILHWLPLWVRYCPRILNLGDNVHAFDDVPKDDVLAVQVRGAILCSDDEELRTVGIRT